MLLLLASLVATALPNPVATAVATGDCATVLARTADPPDPGTALVRGRCLVRTGEHAAALDILTRVDGPILGPHARLDRARALSALSRHAEALRTLDGLDLPSQDLEIRLLRGASLVQLGRSLDARPDLRRLLDTDVGDAARWWLAVGGWDRGDKAAALATWRRLWADSVRGAWSDKAASALADRGEAVPDVRRPEGRALVRDRIRALDGARRYTQALTLREALAEVDPPTRWTAKRDLARARFRGRNYEGAVALYRALHGPPAEASGSARDLFDDALGTSRTGDYDTAAVLYRRLIDQHPGSSKAVTAHYKLGYLEVDRSEHTAARPLLQAHLDRHPNSPHADEARWWLGWGHFVEGNDRAALDTWDALIRTHPRSSLVPGARYWSARARGRMGDAAAETEGLERVLARHPTSGHAWYAAARLGVRMPARDRVDRPEFTAAQLQDPDLAAFELWRSLGLLDEARDALRPAVRRLKGQGRRTDLALAWALIAAGDYRAGKALARPYCTVPWKDGDPVAMQACWPRPAHRVVEAYAARYGLPELVAYGIMTTESALDPGVTSRAGARGLMQIMPAEAEGLHRPLYGGRPYHPDLLYSAPYNASLGVTELGGKAEALGDLLEGPDLLAAIAAYNGGEAAVRRWVGTLGENPQFDVFAESIGYTETRRYVRKVLGTTMAYRYVYGDAPPPTTAEVDPDRAP